MYYTFQQSKIWEGSSDKFDATQKEYRTKARSEERARKKLPSSSLGRDWLLVAKDTDCPVCDGPATIRFDEGQTIYCKTEICSFMGVLP